MLISSQNTQELHGCSGRTRFCSWLEDRDAKSTVDRARRVWMQAEVHNATSRGFRFKLIAYISIRLQILKAIRDPAENLDFVQISCAGSLFSSLGRP